MSFECNNDLRQLAPYESLPNTNIQNIVVYQAGK